MECGIIFIILDFPIVNKIKILPSITNTYKRQKYQAAQMATNS